MQKQSANSQEAKVVFRNTNKKPYQAPEKIFTDQAQLKAYLVDKVTTNKNKRFNFRIKLT